MLKFNSEVYKVGINALVDVPSAITEKLKAEKGYIWIRGTINEFEFAANLVPTKNGPYRLYVNIPMLKGGQTEIGKTANFAIDQNPKREAIAYRMPELLANALKKEGLQKEFDALSEARRKGILKYLHYLKTDTSRTRNIEKLIGKLIGKLKRKEKDVRIP